MTTLDDFLTAAEAGTVLGLHLQTIKRFCRIGRLKGRKVNNGWLLTRKEVESFASTYEETRGRPAGSNESTDSAVTRSVPQRQ